ncbi:TonB system biopolymer transport component; Chromosome segregation ATPase [hydrothermal vent metagenome]|uniref:TonB system biopolymer transport component Chromosome segregation ATPase n=1 Tax=hydrothermal vent metagenome TaxID=652676 RepID=A0A3B0V4V9_9ZZZZ
MLNNKRERIMQISTKIVKFKKLLALVLAISATSMSYAQLEDVVKTGEAKVKDAQVSQARVNKVVDSSQARLIEYRSLLKQVDGLKVYNTQLATQIESQFLLIDKFEDSTAKVAIIERQMLPLIIKMVESLGQFVELDMPFHEQERAERILFLEENLERADVDISEKFRQVLEVYQVENEYGRKIDSYSQIIQIDGQETEVNILRIGRVAMVAQTKDTKLSAVYDKSTNKWMVLDNRTYRNSIKNGIRMAKKQATISVMTLPIAAPEVAK